MCWICSVWGEGGLEGKAQSEATNTRTLRTYRRATPAEQGDEEKEEEKGTHGYGALSMVGCTSATLPFLHELSSALRARGPGVRARLREERGLLAEDVAEVEEALDGLCAAFGGEGGAEEG